jgi:hypothetical protein
LILSSEHRVNRSFRPLGAAVHQVGVGAQGEAGVGVAQILADGFDRLALVQGGAGVEVPKGVAAVDSLVADANTYEGRAPGMKSR